MSTTPNPFARHRDVQIMEIDPDLAAAMLAHNTSNRPLSQYKADYLGQKMAAGKWLDAGIAHVIFSDEGVLLNGQHTLTGIVRSGCTITTTVSWGVDPAAFAVIDIGIRRSAGQVLQLSGSARGSDAAAIIRLVVKVSRVQRTPTGGWSTFNRAIDNDELLELYQLDPDEWEYCAAIAKRTETAARQTGLTLVRSTVGAIAHLGRQIDATDEQMEQFLGSVASDVNHREGQATTALRRWLMNNPGPHRSNDQVLAYWSVFAKAFEAHIAARETRRVQAWSRNSSATFPTLLPAGEPGFVGRTEVVAGA